MRRRSLTPTARMADGMPARNPEIGLQSREHSPPKRRASAVCDGYQRSHRLGGYQFITLISWCYRDCSPSGRDCCPVRKIPCFHGHENSRRCRLHFAPSVPSVRRSSLPRPPFAGFGIRIPQNLSPAEYRIRTRTHFPQGHILSMSGTGNSAHDGSIPHPPDPMPHKTRRRATAASL